jgi:hypothetical protein
MKQYRVTLKAPASSYRPKEHQHAIAERLEEIATQLTRIADNLQPKPYNRAKTLAEVWANTPGITSNLT